MRIGLISDTHGRLRPDVFDRFSGVDMILHAGDVGPLEVVVELEAIAPVHAVLGNTDMLSLRPRVQEEVRLVLEGYRVVLVHGHQYGTPSASTLRPAYPDADIIVYGHTHRQRVEWASGCLVVNPGAAGPARFDLKPSVAILELGPDVPPDVRHVPLG